MQFMKLCRSTLTLALLMIFSSLTAAQNYYVYVAAESDDEVSLIRFNADTQQAEIVSSTVVGIFPA